MGSVSAFSVTMDKCQLTYERRLSFPGISLLVNCQLASTLDPFFSNTCSPCLIEDSLPHVQSNEGSSSSAPQPYQFIQAIMIGPVSMPAFFSYCVLMCYLPKGLSDCPLVVDVDK